MSLKSMRVGSKTRPSYPVGTEPAWGDPEYEGKLHDYYGVGPYWTIPGPL